MKNKKIKFLASTQIVLLISMSFAVAFILNSSLVSAQEQTPEELSKNKIYTEGSQSIKTSITTPSGGQGVAKLAAAQTAAEIYGKKVEGYGSAGTVYDLIKNQKEFNDLTDEQKKAIGVDDVKYDLNGDIIKVIRTGGGFDEFKDGKLDNSVSDYTGKLGIGPIGIPVKGQFFGHLADGISWAAGAVAVVQIFGGLFGFSDNLKKSLTYSLAGGAFAGQVISGAIGQGYIGGKDKKLLGLNQGQAGLVGGVLVAATIFVLTYKSEKKKIVRYECLPWEPPIGGSSCEECNNDKFRPCSEYRCKALGQACQLLNKGSTEESCAWINPKDTTSPTIEPSKEALNPSELKYTPDKTIRPPALGVKIVRGGDECLEAFTPLEFGLTTNEPAQCKLDYKHTGKLDDMEFYFGENNLYVYNHTQKMRLPGPNTGKAGNESLSPELENDGTFSLYVRCQDANGNQNVDEFAFNFCVDPGPDTTPPIIEKTNIVSGSPVLYNADNFPVEVYVSEPAECKWSRQSKTYDDMENDMECATETYQINSDLLYTCTGNLTGIKNQEDNKFFFRCKDQPNEAYNERNVNVQSYELTLRGTQPLNIIKVEPNETITGSTETVPVDLEVETDDGAEEGKSFCYYSTTGTDDNFIEMFETDNYLHKQTVDLTAGNYKIFFKCIDAGGNIAENSTIFNVLVDKAAPTITRAYREGVDALKVVTNEDAECAYSINSCNFNFDEGLKLIYSNPIIQNNHFVEWKAGVSYYIKCRDEFGNNPNPNECSLTVTPSGIESK